MSWGELIAYNRRWVQLHEGNNHQAEAARRMTVLLDAMEALLADDVIERAARAYEAHTKMHVPIEDHEISCEECGWAFDWRERRFPERPYGPLEYDASRMHERMHEHGMRAAMTAAVEGDER